MTRDALTILLIFLSLDAAVLLLLLILRIRKELLRRKIRHFGDRAEEEVVRYIEEEFPGAILLNDIFLRTEHAVTQIDHILLCKWGVFVIETKSHNGLIQTEGKNWVQIYGDKVVRFHSPVLQNEIHRKALVRVLRRSRRFQNLPVKALVVFTSQKMLRFSKRQEGVLRLQELAPYVKSGGKTTRSNRKAVTAKPGGSYLSREKLEAIEKCIRRARIRSEKQKREHEKRQKRIKQNGWNR